MDIVVSDVLVGLMMALLGLIGVFMAAGATDNEIYLFGLALLGLAICFDFGLIKAHFDRVDEARHDAILAAGVAPARQAAQAGKEAEYV